MATRRRQLPPWLTSVISPRNKVLKKTLSCEKHPIFQIDKPVLDSKLSIENAVQSTQEDNNGTLPEKRYRTRSSAPITEPEKKTVEPRKPKPFIEYNGKVEYATEMIDIACMADILL